MFSRSDFENWIAEWDAWIDGWCKANDTESYCLRHPCWKAYVSKNEKDRLWHDYLPDPYGGSLSEKISAVYLNLNPGPKFPMQKHKTGAYYQSLAAGNTFHGLQQDICNGVLKSVVDDGDKFWPPRLKWAERMSVQNGLPIFSMELVPFHSDSFGGIKYTDEFQEYLQSNFFPAVEYVANNLTSGFRTVLCVGSAYKDLFIKSNFELLLDINESNFSDNDLLELDDWPSTEKDNKSVKVKRSFKIWQSKDSGVKYLHTYAPGGNTAPSPEFDTIQMKMLRS